MFYYYKGLLTNIKFILRSFTFKIVVYIYSFYKL